MRAGALRHQSVWIDLQYKYRQVIYECMEFRREKGWSQSCHLLFKILWVCFSWYPYTKMRGAVVCHHHGGTCALGHGMGFNKREGSLNPSPPCKYELFRAQCDMEFLGTVQAVQGCFVFVFSCLKLWESAMGKDIQRSSSPAASALPILPLDRRQDVAGEGKTKQNKMRLRRTNQCGESCLRWQNPE